MGSTADPRQLRRTGWSSLAGNADRLTGQALRLSMIKALRQKKRSPCIRSLASGHRLVFLQRKRVLVWSRVISELQAHTTVNAAAPCSSRCCWWCCCWCAGGVLLAGFAGRQLSVTQSGRHLCLTGRASLQSGRLDSHLCFSWPLFRDTQTKPLKKRS